MSTTCVVGCKLPHGLRVDLKVGAEVIQIELKGRNAARIVGGYGMTANVPADAFDVWMDEHKHFPYVRNGFVFKHSDMASARAHAKEMRNERTRLEPLDPTAEKGGLKHDDESLKNLRHQRATNPDRNRQIVE